MNRRITLIALASFTALLNARTLAGAQSQPTITLFRGQSFAGAMQTFHTAQMNLVFQQMNNVSSADVRSGTWRLCRQTNLSGPCVTLGPGRYPRLRQWGLDNGVGSMTPL